MTAPSIDEAYEIGTTETPPVEAERLAFEAWMRGRFWPLNAVWKDGAYRGTAAHGDNLCPRAMRTRELWAAWRDRAALAQSKPREGEAA